MIDREQRTRIDNEAIRKTLIIIEHYREDGKGVPYLIEQMEKVKEAFARNDGSMLAGTFGPEIYELLIDEPWRSGTVSMVISIVATVRQIPYSPEVPG